jgi:hypothetical protein
MVGLLRAQSNNRHYHLCSLGILMTWKQYSKVRRSLVTYVPGTHIRT